MRTQNLITVMFLLGVGACSAEEGSISQEAPTAKDSQAVTMKAHRGTPLSTKRVRANATATVLAAPRKVEAPKLLGPQQAATRTAGQPSTAVPSGAPTTADTSSRAFADPEHAASASLGTLAELVANGQPEKRGFGSATEAKSASVADGMPVYLVRLDKLLAHSKGQDPKSLMMDKQEVMYPITVAGDVRTSVTVQRRGDGNWEAAMFTHGPTAANLHSARRSVLSKRSSDTGAASVIEIPSVHALLLSHTEKGVLMVTPVYDIPGTSLKAGDTLKAADVFAALQPIAAAVDTSAPN